MRDWFNNFHEIDILQTLMPVIFGHTPAGTSTKTVVHYAQEIHESKLHIACGQAF